MLPTISKELECAICGCLFIDPRILRCQHCFCLRCLFSQAMHNHADYITITCAFRCTPPTITDGDIRSLPRNLAISNIVALLRRERARSLDAQFRQTTEKIEGPSDIAECDAEHASGSSSLPAALRETQQDGRHECEWCSRSCPRCELCKRCLSRICVDCSGQFSDHSFLCCPSHDHHPRQSTHDPREVLSGGSEADVPGHRSLAYPFVIPPTAVRGILHNFLSVVERVLLSRVVIHGLRPIMIAWHVDTVACIQSDLNFTVLLDVMRRSSVGGGAYFQPKSCHWCREDKGLEALLFTSNMIRLGGSVLKMIDEVSAVMSALLEELSSTAKAFLVEKNRGFHMFVLHCAMISRQTLLIVRYCVTLQLARVRAVQGIMGEMVVTQGNQLYAQAEVSRRYHVGRQMSSFMKIDLLLFKELSQMIGSIEAACFGLEFIIVNIMKRLSDCHNPDLSARPTSTVIARSRIKHEKSEPIFDPLADGTFLGQFDERSDTARLLTCNFLGVCECFLKIRRWAWQHTNTTIRACGMEGEDSTSIINAEEALQSQTDALITLFHEVTRQQYVWELWCIQSDRDGHKGTTTGTLQRVIHLVSTTFTFPPWDSTAGQEMQHTTDLIIEIRGLMNNDLERTNGDHIPRLNLCGQFTTLMNDHLTWHLRVLPEVISLEKMGSAVVHTFFKESQLRCDSDVVYKDEIFDLGVIHLLTRLDDETLQHYFDLDPLQNKLRCRHITDFCRREVELSASKNLGENLVQAAHGVFPGETGGLNGARVTHPEASVAPSAFHAVTTEAPSLFPSGRGHPSTGSSSCRLSSTTTISGLAHAHCDHGGELRGALGLSNVMPSYSASRMSITTPADSPETVVTEETAQWLTGAADLGGENSVSLQLFAADPHALPVLQFEAEAQSGEESSIAEATKTLKQHYRLGSDRATVVRNSTRVLPFYEGNYTYGDAADACNFLVDGQTGEIYLFPRGEADDVEAETHGIFAFLAANIVFHFLLRSAKRFLKKSSLQ